MEGGILGKKGERNVFKLSSHGVNGQIYRRPAWGFDLVHCGGSNMSTEDRLAAYFVYHLVSVWLFSVEVFLTARW